MATNDGPTFDYSEMTARNVNLVRYRSPRPIVPPGTVSTRVQALEEDAARSQEDDHLDSLSRSPSSESEEDELTATIPKILPRSQWEILSIPPIFSPKPKSQHLVRKDSLNLSAIADEMARMEAEKLAIAPVRVTDIPKKSRIWSRSSKAKNSYADKEALEEPDSSDNRHNIGQYFVEKGFYSDDKPVAISLRGSQNFDDAFTRIDTPQTSPSTLKGTTCSYSSIETEPYAAGKLSMTPTSVSKAHSIHSIGEPILNRTSHTAGSVRPRTLSNSMKPKPRSSQLPKPLQSDPSNKSGSINSYHTFPSPPLVSKSDSRWKSLLKGSRHALSGFRDHHSKAGNTHDKFDHRGDPHEALRVVRDDWYEPNNHLASPLLAAAKRQFRASESFSEEKTTHKADKDKGKKRAFPPEDGPVQKNAGKNRYDTQPKGKPKHRHRLSLYQRKSSNIVEHYADVKNDKSGRSGDLRTLRREQARADRSSNEDDREGPDRVLTPWGGSWQ